MAGYRGDNRTPMAWQHRDLNMSEHGHSHRNFITNNLIIACHFNRDILNVSSPFDRTGDGFLMHPFDQTLDILLNNIFNFHQ